MNVLLLGGNSLRNQKWLHELEAVLSPEFENIVAIDYNHWINGAKMIDFELELENLKSLDLDSLVIFAKSIGSVLAIKAIAANIIKPQKCIFAGFPLVLLQRDNESTEDFLSINKNPTLIFQNQKDPLGDFKELESIINDSKLQNYSLYKMGGDTHDYVEFEVMKELINNFIKDRTSCFL